MKQKIRVADHLKSLTDEELMGIYHSSFFFDFKLPEYSKYLQDEITRRGIVLKRVGKK